MAIDTPLSVKYRPKLLTDVIGQPVVVQAFTNAFKCKTLHHAYILAGNYGTGKTSISRIVAAMDNCEEGPSLEPCGKCDNCQDIFAGKSVDVKELNGADNRKIDDIRAIRKSLYQYPIQCRVKYVILDECHSLTSQAEEAALKMLEEPPEFVRFILCTTEPHDLRKTIRSRCVMWKLNKVGWNDLANHLTDIVKRENLTDKCDPKALRVAAKMAKGSVRDALQNLQTIINFVGDEDITFEAAIKSLGAVNSVWYFKLIDAIVNSKAPDCYIIINNIFNEGKEAGSIVSDIYEHLNNLLLVKTCKKDLSQFSFTDNEIKMYSHQAEHVGGEMILKMLGFIKDVGEGMVYNLDPQNTFNKFAVQSILENNKSKIKK